MRTKVGYVFRELRLDRGLSQHEISFESKMSRSAYQLIESGFKVPTELEIIKICDAIGANPEKLINIVRKAID